MGLSLKFLIVSQDHLARILSNAEYHLPNDAIEQSADFSLHLIPRHLDILSETFGQYIAQPPRKLRPYLIQMLDKADHGVMMIEHQWVEYVAAAYASNVNDVVESWARSMKIPATSHMNVAVTDLIALCVAAQKDSLPVLHQWAL